MQELNMFPIVMAGFGIVISFIGFLVTVIGFLVRSKLLAIETSIVSISMDIKTLTTVRLVAVEKDLAITRRDLKRAFEIIDENTVKLLGYDKYCVNLSSSVERLEQKFILLRGKSSPD